MHRRPVQRALIDLRLLLRSTWAIHRRGESLDGLVRRFFAEGGRVEPDDILPGVEIHEPEWLRRRVARAAWIRPPRGPF